MKNSIVWNAVDRLALHADRWKGKRIGMLTHAPALTADFRRSADAVNDVLDLVLLWGPEHGLDGTVQDGKKITDSRDPGTGLPVISLFGEKRVPSAEEFAQVDAVFCDVSDIGSRYYTFIYTMSDVMQACASAGVPVVILDRPNPIGGTRCEGILLEPDCTENCAGHFAIPSRHAMTAGECAILFNTRFGIGCDLTVLPCEGWRREMEFEDYALSWTNPSPNIAGADAARLYAGTCLFEGTNVSEGRGTTRPFEIIGAPFIREDQLERAFNACGIRGIRAHGCRFIPMFGKYQGEVCKGVQLHLTDRRNSDNFAAGVRLVEILRNDYPEFEFKIPDYFDYLLGSGKFRTGKESATELIGRAEAESRDFLAGIRDILLY